MQTSLIKFAVVICFIVLAFSSSADDRDFRQSSYLFYLYYDNGQLFADRDFEFVYDVVPEEFVPETVNSPNPFRGEIVTFNNQVAGTFVFDPRRGNPKFLKGKITVKAPYASDGQKAVFYDSQQRQILTVFIGESSFCNDDGVCNEANGENTDTCSADCKAVTPIYVTTGDEDGGQSSMPSAFIYVLIIAGAVLGGWFGWKKWQSRNQTPLPPNIPFDPFQKPNGQ